MKRKSLLLPRPGASGWYSRGFLLLDSMAGGFFVVTLIVPSVFMMQETMRIYARSRTWRQEASIARNEMEYQKIKRNGMEDRTYWIRGKPYYVHCAKSMWHSGCVKYDVEVRADGEKPFHCMRLGRENMP